MSGPLVREGYTGTGPGSITPDGCAVELYARLSVGTEPEVIASVLRPGASILELGCGAGRV
ncbi:SAM-dependent methyltransferase, partial [[Kitasatospora] papulosa]